MKSAGDWLPSAPTDELARARWQRIMRDTRAAELFGPAQDREISQAEAELDAWREKFGHRLGPEQCRLLAKVASLFGYPD